MGMFSISMTFSTGWDYYFQLINYILHSLHSLIRMYLDYDQGSALSSTTFAITLLTDYPRNA